jgi:hypothetical protein
MPVLGESVNGGEITLCLPEPGVTDAGEGVNEESLLIVWTREIPEEALLIPLPGDGFSEGLLRGELLEVIGSGFMSAGTKLECRRCWM